MHAYIHRPATHIHTCLNILNSPFEYLASSSISHALALIRCTQVLLKGEKKYVQSKGVVYGVITASWFKFTGVYKHCFPSL